MRSPKILPAPSSATKPGASYPLKFPLIRHRCIFWHLPGINPAVRYDEPLIPVTGAGQAPGMSCVPAYLICICAPFLFAACISFYCAITSIISYASLFRQKSGKPLVSPDPWRVHMEHIRPTHTSMHVRLYSMLTFAFANIISYFFISTLYISVILPQLSHLYLHAKMLTYQHLLRIIRNIDLSTSHKGAPMDHRFETFSLSILELNRYLQKNQRAGDETVRAEGQSHHNVSIIWDSTRRG